MDKSNTLKPTNLQQRRPSIKTSCLEVNPSLEPQLDPATRRIYLFYHYMEAHAQIDKLAKAYARQSGGWLNPTVKKFKLNLDWLQDYAKFIYKQNETTLIEFLADSSQIKPYRAFVENVVFPQHEGYLMEQVVRAYYDMLAKLGLTAHIGKSVLKKSEEKFDGEKITKSGIKQKFVEFIVFAVTINLYRFEIAESELTDYNYGLEGRFKTVDSMVRFRSLFERSQAIDKTEPSMGEPESRRAEKLKRIDAGEIADSDDEEDGDGRDDGGPKSEEPLYPLQSILDYSELIIAAGALEALKVKIDEYEDEDAKIAAAIASKEKHLAETNK